jgi:hypothetical protein
MSLHGMALRWPRVIWIGEHHAASMPLAEQRLTVSWKPLRVEGRKVVIEGTVEAEGLAERSLMTGDVVPKENATLEYRMDFAGDGGTPLRLHLSQRLRPLTFRSLTELCGWIVPVNGACAFPERRVATLRFDWRSGSL